MRGASQIAPFGLRMPEELKDAIAERAKASGRSMNSEIVKILQDAISDDSPSSFTKESFYEERERLIAEKQGVSKEFWANANLTPDAHLDGRLSKLDEIASRLEALLAEKKGAE